MRWGASDVHFVRPVHTVTLLLGDKVIRPLSLVFRPNRVIRGHRFMASRSSPSTMPTSTADPAGARKVIADYEQRKAKIKADAQERRVRSAVKPI
ncbi:glycyl-tRNA synthetase subunit beta [Klebsiella pneumoniae]|uniref:Glycine--tRNA ligase beta subunit n=1 Tax=Klebsiella pneumoniae TaxID=573 RepID=A0A377U2M9_KLEPN|nr:glycyl-tRNA synthetase subunit beta [Klebsiella pneumoniae]